MSNTQSAHVCTAEAPLILRAHIDYMPQVDNERRFWIVDTRAPSDIPPPNAPSLDELLLPATLETADAYALGHRRDTLWCKGSNADIYAYRHHDEFDAKHFPACIGRWTVSMERKDEHGRTWGRIAVCVVDDHGWLVEVPTC